MCCYLIAVFMLFAIKGFSQCPCDNYSTSSGCGAVNISVSSLGSGVFCIGDSAGISIDSTSGNIDSIYICWQDGSYSAFDGNFTGPVYHHYTYDPDTCPSPPGGILPQDITICVLDTCGTVGAYSYKKFVTSITLHFRPHVEFVLLPDDSVCVFEVASLLMKTCANSQQVSPATYVLSWGDTSAPITGIAYTDPFGIATIFDPPIVDYSYAVPGNYTVSLVVTQHGSSPGDSCGTAGFNRNIYIKPPTSINPVLNLFDSCVPPTITFFPVANGANVSSYSWSAPGNNGTITINQATTATPTVNVTGVTSPDPYLHLDVTGCCFGATPDCTFDTLIHFTQGPNVSVNSIPDSCEHATIDPLSYFNVPPLLVSYQWLFPGSNTPTSSAYNPGPVYYANPGVYTITCIVESSCSIDTLTNTLQIGVLPVACLTPDLIVDCDTLDVTIQAAGCPAGLTYNWQPGTLNFTSGTGSSQAPTLQFVNGGVNNYSVTISSPGCNNLVSNFVATVNQSPQLTQINTLIPGCDSVFSYLLTDYFQFNGSAVDSVLWTTGLIGSTIIDSTTSYTPNAININGSGSYFMNLTAYNDCGTTTLTDTFVVQPPVYLSISDINLCKEDPVYILPTQAGVTWYLNSNLLSPAEINPYVLTQALNSLSYSSGTGNCTVGDTVNVNVTGLSVSAGNDTSFCGNGATYQFSGLPTGFAFSWTGNGIVNPNGTYDPSLITNGNDTLVFTVTENTCITHDTLIVFVGAPPVASLAFLADTLCIADTLILLNSVPGTTATWDFGDASGLITGNNVSHIYASQNTYNITLYLEDASLCSDTATEDIVVIGAPDASYTVVTPQGCSPLTTDFTNLSTNNSYTTFTWNFGNTQSSNLYNPPSQQYISASTGDSVIVTTYLTSQNSCGTAIDSQIVIIDVPPAALLGYSQGIPCSPDTIDFLNASSGVIDSVHLYANGVLLSNTKNIPDQVLYALVNDSTYQLTLVAFNKCGSDTNIQTIVVHPGIVHTIANASILTPCVNENVVFTAITTPSSANILWLFGDGFNAITNPANHIYTDDSARIVTLYASDPNGCGLDSSFLYVDPIELPVAGFSSNSPVCGNDTLRLFNNSSAANPFSSIWDLGNSTIDSLDISPALVYNDTGVFVITLTVSDVVTKCSSTITDQINLLPFPTASFALLNQDPCVHLVQTINNSLNADFYQWTYGTGAIATGFEPAFLFDSSGTYSIYLTALNGSCVDDTVVSNISINPVPKASFYPVPYRASIQNPAFNFINTSSGDSLIAVAWFFGDGTFTYEDPASHTYADTGRYVVKQIVTNIWNCTDTMEQEIWVDPEFYIYVPSSFTPNNDDHNETFNAYGWYVSGFNLTVYSRFGEIVFDNNGNINRSWDGNARNGAKAMQGVYVYRLVWNDRITGDEREKRGVVTLIR
jgi:gliding motility-associated-like protein